ncbi:FG-GAP repeat domain-containing protein [Pseudothioglobus sp. nBUS_23]|uniref:FG-GAP repeat domain-containing protein n=1 Tax=Pseudothioglobus sp. nBUS_23 TaxID=3395318 RepID=UPI003EBA01B5
MKKLFLLLILSFFSVQSLAGSCPDGSEPIKSISEDGTYFVFNCGVSNEQSSSNSNDSSSSSSVKAVKFESFVDTETSSSCKDLDTNFYRKSSNKCSIIAVLDRKPKFPGGHWFKNVWQTSGLLIHRVNKNGNLEIVGKAENIQVETNEKTDRPGQMEIATIEVNTEELGSKSVEVIKNPIVEIPASTIRMVLTDVNQDGLTELVIAGMLEDGRHQDSSWKDVNYIYDFETESYTKFGKPMYSHDFVAGDLDDDGYDDFIDISWGGDHQGSGIGVCNGKSLECVYQNHPTRLQTSKTSLSVYPNKKGGILFHNCDKEYLSWCWSEVTYNNWGIELKPLDKYIASKKPDKEELFNNWSGWEQKRKGWAVPGYETSERFKLISESYRSHQFDMDGDGDFDTATWKENRLCKKSASEKVYQITSDCKPVGEMFFFRNDNGKFTVSDRHEIDPGATTRLYSFDINQDGHMDFYAFRDEWNTFECNNQINNIFFGNGDGTFRRPSVKEQSEIFGNYGCEIQSYFFDFEGDSYRTFFTHKYSKNFSGSRAVYVGVEKLANN